jgi:hypothetical protein
MLRSSMSRRVTLKLRYKIGVLCIAKIAVARQNPVRSWIQRFARLHRAGVPCPPRGFRAKIDHASSVDLQLPRVCASPKPGPVVESAGCAERIPYCFMESAYEEAPESAVLSLGIRAMGHGIRASAGQSTSWKMKTPSWHRQGRAPSFHLHSSSPDVGRFARWFLVARCTGGV